MSIIVKYEGKEWQLPAWTKESFEQAKKNYPESHVWIFGDEPKKVKLKELEVKD